MRPAERRLLQQAAAARLAIATSAALGVAAGLVTVPIAWTLAGIVARAFLQHRAEVRPVLVLAALFACRAVCELGSRLVGHAGAARIRRRLRAGAVDAVLEMAPSALAEERAGELVTVLARGLDALDGYFSGYLPQLVAALTVPIALVAWTAPHDLVSAVILAVTVPLVPVFMALVGLATRDRTERRWQALGQLSAYLLDLLRGLPALRAFDRGAEKAESVRQAAEAYSRETMAALRGTFLSSLVLELAATIGTAMVAVAIGLRLDAGTLDFQTGLAVLVLAPEVYLPLRRLGAQYHASLDAVSPAERLEVLATAARARRRQVPAAGGAVEVTGVRFRRRGRGVVLDEVDMRVRPGEKVAVMGPSGSGKSTLLAVMLGFEQPERGTVRVHRDVAWLPQQPVFIEGTAAGNLVPAATAQVLGLEDVAGRDARRLSAGERQRAALARVLSRRSRVLLLDEPTAHLDPNRARQVAGMIGGLRDRTVVVATHSREVAAACDRVFELENGRLVERNVEAAV